MSGLGRIALDQGETGLAAREYLTESLQVCRNIGTRIGIARGLESFAALADRDGDAERAVLLAAASAGLRAASGLPPLAGARTARYLAAADRLGAGTGTGARLWERGLALPPEARHRPGGLHRMSAQWPPQTGPGAGTAPPAPPPAPPSALTPRELEIAALIAAGRSNKAIAAELVISPATAAKHVANIMTKLGFRSRAQIAVWATGRK